jgi:hypothetical protein
MVPPYFSAGAFAAYSVALWALAVEIVLLVIGQTIHAEAVL